jgi:hypothetical protein
MESMIAFCGLKCDSCPIYLATLEEDALLQHTMRESIAEQCSKVYGMNIQTEDVTDCDGCRSNTGRLFSGCLGCEIRKCAIQKNTVNCAYCSDYACATLMQHFSTDKSAETRLEEIRRMNRYNHC